MRSAVMMAAVAAVLAGGCAEREGLSRREGGQQSMPMLMYTAAAATSTDVTGPVQIKTPSRVGVAQVGELVPPPAMMDSLRAHPELFSKVSPITGSMHNQDVPPDSANRYGNDRAVVVTADQPDQLSQMRRLAASVGMDYLLVFGGQIDHGTQGTGLELLDLTIVGAFIVPSHGVSVDGRAAGSLIDVATGRVVQSYAAEAKGTGAAPSAFLGAIEQGAIQKNREELVVKLTADVVKQMTEEYNSNANRK